LDISAQRIFIRDGVGFGGDFGICAGDYIADGVFETAGGAAGSRGVVCGGN